MMSDNSSDSTSVTCSSSSLKMDKICLVCGDKALGYNFNAVSCESCKAFFRRNAHKTIKGRCQGNCDVTVESRSFCKRCRQQKCFAVGMRKEMILNAEQKKSRKMKIIRNRQRRNGKSFDEPGAEEEEILISECVGNTSIQTSRTPTCSLASSSSELDEAASPIAHLKPSIVKLAEEALAKLEPSYQSLMDELNRAHELALKIPVKTSLKGTPSSATQFFNLAEGSVLRMVKFAKEISSFSMLTKDDQIALLKGAVTEIMMMRSAMYFDSKSKNWDVSAHPSTSHSSIAATVNRPDCHDSSSTEPSSSSGSVVTRFLDGGTLNKFSEDTKNMFKEYKKFATSLLTLCRGDLTIIKLLSALALFSSDRPDVEQQELIQRKQESYADLLRSYTDVRFPDEPGLFPRIMMKLTDMRDIGEIHSKMLAKMNVVEVEPLLVEVFNLGQDG